jgi:hypothetical protein
MMREATPLMGEGDDLDEPQSTQPNDSQDVVNCECRVSAREGNMVSKGVLWICSADIHRCDVWNAKDFNMQSVMDTKIMRLMIALFVIHVSEFSREKKSDSKKFDHCVYVVEHCASCGAKRVCLLNASANTLVR